MSLEDNLYPLLKLYETAPQPLKTLAGRIYRAIPATLRHGPGYERFCEEANAVETWDAERVRQYQIKELRSTLQVASRTPYYSALFAGRRLDPARFDSLEQLAEYPMLNREDVARHREAMVNPDSSESRRLYITTGGSSGMPLGFYLHKGVSRAKEQAHLEAMWSRAGYTPGVGVAVIRGHTITGTRPWYYDSTRNWLIMSSAMLDAENCTAYVDEINRFQPEFIHAYPSSAMILARHLESRSLKLEVPLKGLLCGSEHLSCVDRSWLETVFQTRVFRWYGHSERVLLAGERNGMDGFHYCPAYGFVEFGPMNESGLREIIGTSFHNHVMPFVRYRTGDFAKVADTSGGWPCVVEIAGRESEFLVAADGRRVPVTVVNRHDDSFDCVRSIQFHQHEPGKLEVHYVSGPQFKVEMLAGIESQILRQIGSGFQLQFREVDEVKKTRAGKQRWLVSTLNHKI